MTEGGRVFFSRSRQAATRETIRLTSLGIDIGSTTTHLVLSRLAVERQGGRSQVMSRQVLYRSPVLLTPVTADGGLDIAVLRRFLADVYARAVIDPEAIDCGALVVTGLSAERVNARDVAAALAFESGRFVAVSAGDALEARLAASGAGAVARSVRETVLHVDIGGGTSKIARCEGGRIVALTATDVGARRGTDVTALAQALVRSMGLAPMEAAALALHRLPPLPPAARPAVVSVSGGVAEYLFGAETRDFGDHGRALATAFGAALAASGVTPVRLAEGLRATVMGASQHSVRLSGGTVYVAPDDCLPLQGLRVVVPEFDLSGETIDPARVAAALRAALTGETGPCAIAYRWDGPASFARLDGFCRGVGLAMPAGDPLVLVGERDVGGLVGVHAHHEARVASRVVSLDGLTVGALDWIDIGEMLEGTGAVPVVVTSLVFG